MAKLRRLVTTRLEIEPFTAAHITSRYVSWLNDPDVVRYSEQRHRTHTEESCHLFLKTFKKSPNFFSAVLAKDTAVGHVGNITVTVDPANSVADMAILIGEKPAWGKGYGSEAWSEVMRELFEGCGIRKVTAGTMSENEGMLAIMRKTGMVEDGQRHRHFIYDGREINLVHAAAYARSLESNP